MISKDDIDAMAHTKEQKEYWEVPMNNAGQMITEINLLKKNVRDLQEQLQNAYKRIKELSERE
jgi:HAMP domain-containing protein